MVYLLRVVLPDRPGSLGVLATALGQVGADIVSLDVVERGPGFAVDDVVCELPAGGLADVLLTACHTVPGVTVEALRPFQSHLEVVRDLELVEELADRRGCALRTLVQRAPDVFRAGWGLLLAAEKGAVEVTQASPGAPDLKDVALPWFPLPTARTVDPDEGWAPERFQALAVAMVAAPVGRADRVVLLGRPGGPTFRASEVLRLAHLAGITATVAGPDPG